MIRKRFCTGFSMVTILESNEWQKKFEWQKRLAVPGGIFSATSIVTGCFYNHLSSILLPSR